MGALSLGVFLERPMLATTGTFGHIPFALLSISRSLTTAAPGLLKPILFTKALSEWARNILGLGLPSCGNLVIPPYSIHEKPKAGHALSASAPLSNPAASPNG